jgi:hypothetical protein
MWLVALPLLSSMGNNLAVWRLEEEDARHRIAVGDERVCRKLLNLW